MGIYDELRGPRTYSAAYRLHRIERVRKKRQIRRILAIRTLGGKCSKCLCTENLEVDHIIPRNGEDKTRLSRIINLSLVNFLEELKKCQLLCIKCHKQKSNQEKFREYCPYGHQKKFTINRKHFKCKTCDNLKHKR